MFKGKYVKYLHHFTNFIFHIKWQGEIFNHISNTAVIFRHWQRWFFKLHPRIKRWNDDFQILWIQFMENKLFHSSKLVPNFHSYILPVSTILLVFLSIQKKCEVVVVSFCNQQYDIGFFLSSPDNTWIGFNWLGKIRIRKILTEARGPPTLRPGRGVGVKNTVQMRRENGWWCVVCLRAPRKLTGVDFWTGGSLAKALVNRTFFFFFQFASSWLVD